MSDKKISDLVELTTLAADDVLPVVDSSANATKRITGANLSSGIRGDIVSGDMPAGSIVQVVQGTTTTEVTVASTSYADIGLEASITPNSTDNKVLVLFSVAAQIDRNANSLGSRVQLLRNGSAVAGLDAMRKALNIRADGSSRVQVGTFINYNFLDFPNTTGALTYKMQARSSTTSSGANIRCQVDNAPSTITLMEVVG